MKQRLYAAIYDDLRRKILGNKYEEGSLLPREIDLAESYGVSRETVRQALNLLEEEGLVLRKRRAGTLVLPRKIRQECTLQIESFRDEMVRRGIETTTKVISIGLETADEHTCEILDLNPGDKVIRLVRQRFAGESPFVLVNTLLPEKNLPNLMANDFNTVNLYDVLYESYFLPINRIERRIEVHQADQNAAEQLWVDKGAAIFHLTSVGYSDLLPVEYSHSDFRGDKAFFFLEIKDSNALS